MELSMGMDMMQGWMKCPGKVKKLQLYLIISVIFSLFLSFQLVSANLKLSSLEKNIKFKKASVLPAVNAPDAASQDTSADSELVKRSESELRNFIENYFVKFFELDEGAHLFVESHSEQALFEANIAPELNTRKEQAINSKLVLKNMFLESLDAKRAKAVIFAREEFPNHDYENRDFIIEAIVDVAGLKIVSIPVFKVE